MAGLNLRGDTSGSVEIVSPAVAGDNTITLPNDNGSANQFFKNSTTAGIVTHSSMIEDASGNIGIGTTTPTETLHVVGDARVTGILTVGTASVTLNGDTGVISGINTINGISYPSGGQLFARNMVDNGEMQIAQRAMPITGIADASGILEYGIDRFTFGVQDIGTWTYDQGSGISTEGFTNSAKMTCTSGDASTTGVEYALLIHYIEAQDCQRLKFGTSAAESITLSFWVKSNKTGNASFDFRIEDNSYQLASAGYTINSANTWEYKTITFNGDTASTIANDNGRGLQMTWWLNSGPDFSGGSFQDWGALVNANRNVNNLGVGGETNDYFEITGIQLETGTRATPFEHRTYQEYLNKCLRYYADTRSTAVNSALTIGQAISSARIGVSLNWKQTMRAAPTVTIYSSANTAGKVTNYNSNTEPSGTTFTSSNASRLGIQHVTGGSGLTSGNWYRFRYTAVSEL